MKKNSQSMIAVIALLAALSLTFAACAGGNHAADKESTTPTQTADITEKNNDETKGEGSTAETTVNNGNIQESPNNGTGNSNKPSTPNPTPTTPTPTPTSPSNPPANNQPQNPSTPSNPPVNNNEHQHNYVTTTETVHHDAVYNEVKHEAEYENVWVVDKEAKPDTITQEPIYGEREVFSLTDRRTDETFHFYAQDAAYWAKRAEIGAGNCITGYCIEEYVIGYQEVNWHDGYPEQGHWENQLVKAAWTENVLVKAAWDETITKSVCSICGKQK